MGKRKKSARSKMGGKKARMAPLDKSFRCLFCNNASTISCKLDKSSGIGTLVCSSCNQTFSHKINHLSEPIDLYSDWIDACEAVNED
ncbi:transcription elongation factor 1, partial [Atractiella rhizophila]